MAVVDVIDETYVAVAPHTLRAVVCDEVAWQQVLPDLRLRCYDDRGVRGKRWTVSGALEGTAEVWLEETAEGTVVHLFLQADPTSGGLPAPGSRAARRCDKRYRDRLKRWVTEVRDRADDARTVGTRPSHVASAGDETPDRPR